eukprot:symbB.v1.2.033538.t1/scaffold4180.1/size43445/3
MVGKHFFATGDNPALFTQTHCRRTLSQGLDISQGLLIQRRRWNSFLQVPCKKVVNDAYFCAKPHETGAEPKVELPKQYAKSFAEQVAVLGELSRDSTVSLGKASQLIQKTQRHLEKVQHGLHEAKEAGLVGRRSDVFEAVAADAAKEAEAAKIKADRAKSFCNLAVQNATSGPLQKAQQQGEGQVTEPLLSSMEAVRGPGTIVTPWSGHSAHPPGLYCEKVCEDRHAI